ncbi:MAG: restriction endonuclease [Burkholderiales bacterium]|nr:restriction endonuclease [Burkholderiales bacterium]MBH2016199.1 restriction endonuclease [Burkholderiales bacterium]
MGRRRTSVLDELLQLASRLHPWVGLILALVSYGYLSWLAQKPVPTPSPVPGQLSALVMGSLIQSLAKIGQFLLPGVFLVGALVSFIRRKKNEQLVETATATPGTEAVTGMSWREFELLVGEGFRRRGFGVKDLGGQGLDGGVDLVLSRGSERYLVQCKQWRAAKVGVAILRELYGVMAAQGVAGGYVVTSGAFTKDAVDFSVGRNIELIDGPKLRRLLEDAKSGAAPRQAVPAQEIRRDRLMPTCPKCNADMKLREARKGSQAGNRFWGCSRFPDCRGTSPLQSN